MTTAAITGYIGANARMPFADKGDRKPRASVSTLDPILSEEGEDGKTVYDPGRGFCSIFSQNHSTFASASGNKNTSYNNYVCLKDLNLIFYLASIGNYLSKYGLMFPYSQDLSDRHGGYPWGAVVDDGLGNRYISTKFNNTDAIGDGTSSWIKIRDSWWFNSSNHNDNRENQVVQSPVYTIMFRHPETEGSSSLPFYRTSVPYQETTSSSTRVAGIPLIVYRLHSVKEVSGSQTTYTWVQAYKYWIRAYPNQASYNRYNGQGEVPQGWGSNPVMLDDDSKYYVYLYADIATKTQLKGKDDETSAKVYMNSSSAGKVAGYMTAIGVAGSTYDGDAGAFTIDWGGTSESPYNNPFNSVISTYSNQYLAINLELAMDIGRYGYGGYGQIPVVPEYDETEGTISSSGSLTVDKAASGSVTDYETYDNLRTGRNCLTGGMAFCISNSNSAEVILERDESVLYTTDNIGQEGEYLKSDGSATLLTHAETDSTCPIAFPFSKAEDHHRLSSGPFFIRKSLSLDLYYQYDSGSDQKQVKIANLGRQSWYEYTSGKIQRSRSGYSWWVYNVESVNDVLVGPNMTQYRYLAIPAPEVTPFFVSKGGLGTDPAAGDYVAKLTVENIGLPRQFHATQTSNAITGYGVLFDPIHGTYVQKRMLIGLSAFPYEHVPNILTTESFPILKPDVW